MENKLVCGCFNLTVEDLKSAIAGGAKTFEEVQQVTKIGTGCTSCAAGARAIVEELL